MSIECPACHMEFDDADLEHTLKDGFYQCPVCGKRIASSLTENEPEKKSPQNRLVLCLLAIILVLGAWIFFRGGDTGKSSQESLPQQGVPSNVPQVSDQPASTPLPTRNVDIPSLPAPAPPVPAVDSTPRTSPAPTQDKLRIVEKIAMDFHKSHTYTLEGDFVCLDMAIAVWNQVMTNGIPAKIMVGNVQEDITWSYKALVLRCNHAWVLARISPNEEVAIETTEGSVFKKDMRNASLYFKGIEFDSPVQVKEFDMLRKGIFVCRDANEMVTDWNENVAGKRQRVTADIIEKKAITEERVKTCETILGGLEKYKSRAVYY